MSDSERILVTGAGGFIGRHMISALEAAGRSCSPWTREDGNLFDESIVKSRLMSMKPSLILHLAALPANQAKEDAKVAVSNEIRMIRNLATAMPIECRLVFTGSMAEYGYSGYLGEDDICKPQTIYGAAKLGCTNYALSTRVKQSLDIRVARLFGVYGLGEMPTRLFPYLVSQLIAGKSVSLSDGSQCRDFVGVADVCSSIINIADASELPSPLINIGTGIGVTVREACEMVAEVLAVDPSLLRFGEVPRRSVDEDFLVAKTDLIAKLGPIPQQHWLSIDAISDFIEQLATFQRDS
jgi:nucleoside-diphosphate-sugar epimerase